MPNSRSSLIAVLFSLCVTAQSAAATISLTAFTGQGCDDATPVSTTDVAVGASIISTCIGGSGTESINDVVFARGVFDASGLSLGIFAQMQQTTVSNELVDVVGGSVRFTDTITLLGGVTGEVGYLRATFTIDGDYDETLPSLGTGFARLDTTFNVFGGTGSFSTPLTGSTVYTVDLPYIFGTPGAFGAQFSIDWTLLARAGAFGTPKTVDVVADFYDTAVLSSMVVLDAAGRPIANGSVYSASGLRYPAAVAPEPASTLLATVGLLGAGVRRWRQKRT